MNVSNPRHLELAVIGAVMIDPAALRVPELRALQAHHMRHLGGVWAAVRRIESEGREPTLTELAPLVGTAGWPAGFGISDLINIEAYSLRGHELPGAAAGILAAYRHERANAAAAELQRALGNPDVQPLQAMSAAHSTLTELISTTPRDSTASIADDLDSALARILNPLAHRGVTSGLRGLDAVTGGWQPGTLNIVAARPSMGKSALLGQMSQAAALGDSLGPTRALMFTLEDGSTVTRMRTLSRLSGVPIQHDRAPSVAQQAELNMAVQKMEGLRNRWLLDDEASLDGILTTAWRQHAEQPLDVVLIDQLSHILADAPRGKADNRTQLYGYVTKTLKRELAQRLGIPVILASQLSREVTRRGADARPQLTDLRDSGELEQDADTVTLIHRPDYYDPQDSPGMAELIVAKNRNGPTRTVKVSANLKLFKFWEERA